MGSDAGLDGGVAGGPAVVALGGGHGLAVALRAARRYAGSLTAVVTVADDGGSSGRLRRELGVLPPGDLRRCLVALAGDDTLWASAFEHRFAGGELDGHALGNLVLVGLTQTLGSFTLALEEAGRLLGAVGTVLPATDQPVVLHATAREPVSQGGDRSLRRVEGQVAVANTPGIRRVALEPADPAPPAAVLDALASADQVVLAPGSLYTSVLPPLLVPATRAAIAARPAAVSCRSPTCARRCPRPRGSTPPTTWKRCWSTASGSTASSTKSTGNWPPTRDASPGGVSSRCPPTWPATTASRTIPCGWH